MFRIHQRCSWKPEGANDYRHDVHSHYSSLWESSCDGTLLWSDGDSTSESQNGNGVLKTSAWATILTRLTQEAKKPIKDWCGALHMELCVLSSGSLWTLQSLTESGCYAQSSSIQTLIFLTKTSSKTCLYTLASFPPPKTQRTRKTSWDQRFFSFYPPKGSSEKTTIYHACNVNCWWERHIWEYMAWMANIVYKTSTQRRWQKSWRHI